MAMSTLKPTHVCTPYPTGYEPSIQALHQDWVMAAGRQTRPYRVWCLMYSMYASDLQSPPEKRWATGTTFYVDEIKNIRS
jgi:hypothetical protein